MGFFSKDRHQSLISQIEQDLHRRETVWDALQYIFMDTAPDYAQIADVCRKSGYSSQELKDIFLLEVFPALRINLYVVAGEWTGFGREALKELILRHHTRGRWLQPWIGRLDALSEWKKIEDLL